ncbi:MarC family protein, partial [Acinetobacter baumannii]
RHLARAMAVRAVLIAGGILVVFALFGHDILSAIGASLDSFRIAGGILLFVIATEMVLEKRTQRREDRAQKLSEAHVEDVS